MASEPVEAIVSVSETLAHADLARIRDWGSDGESDPEFGELPLVVRLGHLGSTFARAAGRVPADERRNVLAAVESVVINGSEAARTAMTTGFLEAVQHAQDGEFDLQTIWSEIGPHSQDFLRTMDRRRGIEPPEWMISS